MTLFKTWTGTILTKETLICTRNERNFVQLSNVQAVFSANAARKSRLLRCFSPLATLPYLFHPFKWNSSGHLRWKFIFSYLFGWSSDFELNLTLEFKCPIPLKVRSVSRGTFTTLLLLQRYCLSDISQFSSISSCEKT